MKLLSLVSYFFVSSCSLMAPSGATEQSPNFIFILSDDQGWGTTSVKYDPSVPESRSDFFKTPNIESLAASGMRFTKAYAAHPNCSPSRASIQTGRSPAALHLTDIVDRNPGIIKKCPHPGMREICDLGLKKCRGRKKQLCKNNTSDLSLQKIQKKIDSFYFGNKVLPPIHIEDLPFEEKTIAELLKEHNPRYSTAHFGKWHLMGGGPSEHGYDNSDGVIGNAEGSLSENLPNNPKRAFSITNSAVSWLKQKVIEGRPFYLQLSHFAVHKTAQSRPKTIDYFISREKGARHADTLFAAMLYDMDESIGLLLSAVKDAGIEDNTYIIFTSDNGTYSSIDNSSSANGPIRGYKDQLFEGGLRVPFIFSGPGIPANAISEEPVIAWDILPTIMDLANRKSWPQVVEGGSLKPLLLSKAQKVSRPFDGLVFHYPHYNYVLEKRRIEVQRPSSAIIYDGWKLLYTWETGSSSLFNIDDDIGETKDLAKNEQLKTAYLKNKLMMYLNMVEAQIPRNNAEYNPSEDPLRKRSFSLQREPMLFHKNKAPQLQQKRKTKNTM